MSIRHLQIIWSCVTATGAAALSDNCLQHLLVLCMQCDSAPHLLTHEAKLRRSVHSQGHEKGVQTHRVPRTCPLLAIKGAAA